MFEIRHVITRMRLGESDRETERAGLMGRRKAGQLRAIAIDQGWLDPSHPLPPNEELEALVQSPRVQQPPQSLAAPMATLICRRNKKATPTTVFLGHPPAETAQANFVAGPIIIGVHTDEVMKTWFFVMTLTCSKHMSVELVTNQRVETYLGLSSADL